MASLASVYRPDSWEMMIGQESIIRIIRKQIESGLIKNCYLFCGSSGCGKTTLARLVAKEINGGVGFPIEIDAASNNGVDNVRQIISDAQERSLSGTCKVYIIDECQCCSTAAWSAFLKCLEEPPKYTIFIFCTTDPQKIPATILNRVQRFNFTKVPVDLIKNRLSYICEKEHFENYSESVDYIAKISDGGVRTAISYLEKCAAYDINLSIENVLVALGNYSYSTFFKLLNAMIDGNEKAVITIIEELSSSGNDLKLFVEQFFNFCVDVSKYLIFKDCSITKIPLSMEDILKDATEFADSDKYYGYVLDKVLDLRNMIKDDTSLTSTIEAVMLKITRCQ